MKIAGKIAISTILLLTITTGVVTSIVIFSLKKRERITVQDFRESEYERVRQKLKSLVDVTYESVANTYENSSKKDFIRKTYGKRLITIIDSAYSQVQSIYSSYRSGEISEQEAKKSAMELIGSIRYDDGTGYLWINDNVLPKPTMIMHPIAPQLNGQHLDDPKYNVAENSKNLFVAMVEAVQSGGGGFVGYLWPKPGMEKSQPKLSYVKLFEPWGWIIGTGIYVDDAKQEAIDKILDQVAKYRYDDGTGYFWINDNTLPYPKMVMHPIAPQLNGQVLNSKNYNVSGENNENLFVTMVKATKSSPDGYVSYLWPKPGKDKPQPKLSYVKVFRPLNWIIGTGVYTDDIEDEIITRTQELTAKTNRLIGTILFVAVFMIATRAVISLITAKGITRKDKQNHGAAERAGEGRRRPYKKAGTRNIR